MQSAPCFPLTVSPREWSPCRERRGGRLGWLGLSLPQAAPASGPRTFPPAFGPVSDSTAPFQPQPPSWRTLACPSARNKGTPRGHSGSFSGVLTTQAQSEGRPGLLASLLSPSDISWFKGRQPLSARKGVTVSADGRVLHIEQARFSDAGSYRCVAANVAGSTELQYGLRVNGELPWD